MNQKIESLWAQSAQRTDIMNEQRHEQFAKLIIDEIVEIMADPRTYNRCTHTTFDLDRAQCIVSDIVKKLHKEFL